MKIPEKNNELWDIQRQEDGSPTDRQTTGGWLLRTLSGKQEVQNKIFISSLLLWRTHDRENLTDI